MFSDGWLAGVFGAQGLGLIIGSLSYQPTIPSWVINILHLQTPPQLIVALHNLPAVPYLIEMFDQTSPVRSVAPYVIRVIDLTQTLMNFILANLLALSLILFAGTVFLMVLNTIQKSETDVPILSRRSPWRGLLLRAYYLFYLFLLAALAISVNHNQSHQSIGNLTNPWTLLAGLIVICVAMKVTRDADEYNVYARAMVLLFSVFTYEALVEQSDVINKISSWASPTNIHQPLPAIVGFFAVIVSLLIFYLVWSILSLIYRVLFEWTPLPMFVRYLGSTNAGPNLWIFLLTALVIGILIPSFPGFLGPDIVGSMFVLIFTQTILISLQLLAILML